MEVDLGPEIRGGANASIVTLSFLLPGLPTWSSAQDKIQDLSDLNLSTGFRHLRD